MGFLGKKPGLSLYEYNKRFGGYRNEVRRVLNQHNSTKVASHKQKIIDAGVHTMASGGKSKFRGQATSSEVREFINDLKTANFKPQEITGIEKAFAKVLAQKDSTTKSYSLFGTPEGITSTKFSKDTIFGLSPQTKLKQELIRNHGISIGKKRAEEILAIFRPGFKGERGRLDREEKNAAISNIKKLDGVTERDAVAIERILNSAFGEKTSTTPTLHPLSTGNVTHKKTAGLGVTPPPADGVEKSVASSKTPVMHAPPVVKGVHINNAAEVSPEINRALVDTETNVSPAKSSSAHEEEEGSDASHEKKHHKNEDADVHTDSKHDTHHAQNHEELIQATTPHSMQPLSSRPDFKKILKRRREESNPFRQYEQSTTQLTRASHESLTDTHARVRESGTTTFEDRLKKRQEQRSQLNQPVGAHADTHDSTQTFHAPSFHSHTTFNIPSKGTPDSAHETEEKSTPKPYPAQHVSSVSHTSSTHSFTAPRQGHDEHGQFEHATENKVETGTSSGDEASEAPHVSFTPYKTSTHIPTPQEQKPEQEPGEQQNLESKNLEHQETEVENHDTNSITTEHAETSANVSETQPEPAVSEMVSIVVPGEGNSQQQIEPPPLQEGGTGTTHEEKQESNDQSKLEPESETESIPSTSKQTEDATTTHRPTMKLHIPHLPTQDTESVRRKAADEEQAPEVSTNPIVDLKTNFGAIAIELYSKDMPATAEEFLKRAKSGVYNGTKFHRVVKDYVIQAGEVSGGTTEGNTASDEKPEHPHSNMCGTVSMVSADKNAGGGVFSINVVNNVILDGRYPVFGKVIAGMDVVEAISKLPTDANETPKQPVVIESVTVS